MSGVNKVIIIGNIGADPEVRTFPNGNRVASFSVATSKKWKDKVTGQDKVKTEWHKIVTYNALAEIVGKYLRKGSKVYIEGELETTKYTDKAGIERYTTQIICSSLQMLDPKPDNGQSSPQHQQKLNDNQASFQAQEPPPLTEDDCPW